MDCYRYNRIVNDANVKVEKRTSGAKSLFYQPVESRFSGKWIGDGIQQIPNDRNIRERDPGIGVGEVRGGLQTEIFCRFRPH